MRQPRFSFATRFHRGNAVGAICQTELHALSLSFYGLLIVPENGERTANLPAGKSPLDIYLRCGAQSARSFAHFGYDWTLISDRPELLAERCKALGIETPPLRGAEFTLDVPADIPFRAAHHKLELIEKFGTGEFGSKAALVDLDTVCVRPIDERFCAIDGIAGYRLGADEGIECADERLTDSLAILLGDSFRKEWWGGEFLIGDSVSFARLAEDIAALWTVYLAHWQSMLHAGDEMVLGAALQRFESCGGSLVDARETDTIARYWTSRTRHRPRPFRDLDATAILHLPADKEFLSASLDKPFEPGAFRKKLDRHVKGKINRRKLLSFARRDGLMRPRYR